MQEVSSQSGKSGLNLHTLRQPVSTASLAKRQLHYTSSDGEGGTTRGIRGGRVGRRDKGDLMGNLIGPGDFKLVADGACQTVDGVEIGLPISSPGVKSQRLHPG
jgi:hypothetical protein